MQQPDYLKILRQYWGYDNFRGIQRDIIESIGAGHDTLGLMPTGGGKSITFQVPALARDGLCLVVTPLIALMKDQVLHLRSRGIKAAAVYSGMPSDEVLRNLDNCILGDYKFLYVSPERLGSEFFQTKLLHMHVSFVTVDEAHCISQWGYDFRPSYLAISAVRDLLPGVPVLALTATATPRVAADIQRRLGFRRPNVFRMSFSRENLAYVVRTAPNKEGEMLHILRSVPGPAIVYTRSRKGTAELMKLLRAEGITALNYHAGLTNDDKDLRQRSWLEGETRVMVATNAFGMGIDKPDVRLVIHFDSPDSPEAYFQEAGRAGRDGRPAYAVLLWSQSNGAKLSRRLSENFPPKEFIRKIYEHLAYYFQMPMGEGLGTTREFNMDEFCTSFRHFPVQTLSALQILTRAGYINYRDEDENKSRILFLLERDDLYRLHLTTPSAENLIQALLRNYGGVFADYVYIEEQLLARRTQMDPSQVYMLLKQLSRQGIVHYIPRKRTPRITYLTRRMEADELLLGPDVYEDRRNECRERIEAMLQYATANRCRSQMLLQYFGEEKGEACGRCDVCRSQTAPPEKGARRLTLEEKVKELLQDGQWHAPQDISPDGIPTDRVHQLVNEWVRAGRIETKDGRFRLCPGPRKSAS